ncbi:MAG: glutamine-hydrolyzing carbamoyl-phosphate synthase small subunit [Ruminococcaceae bacterium]|nr:glutamine-hydrolyzing carbamoyl-phosphate synthase small subunit [Oscillospiraceae bacterium]
MLKEFDKKIVLEDGSEYYGYAFGAKDKERVTEIVFNTSMVGYQEIVSDPTYINQTVVMTYTLIGNYGITDEDFESKTLTIGGLVVREYNNFPSNFRYTKTLAELMEENDIPGIYGLDTRKLARSIRDNGSCKAYICAASTPLDKALEILKSTEFSKDEVAKVSCKKRWYSRTPNPKYNVVAIDCGIKLSIVRTLNAIGCNVTVIPWDTPASEVEMMKPDGIFISDGPGDPADAVAVIELIKELKGKYPIFGEGLGHQMISLAYGAKISKLKFGHRGCNHPIKDLETGLVSIETQNHSFVVDKDSLSATDLEATHINLLDDTVEGVKCQKDMVWGVQYYPGTEKGPKGSDNFFDKFIKVMKEGKANA